MSFNIQSFQRNGFDIISLQDTVTQTEVQVLPACGAALHAFIIRQDGQPLNLIDNYQSLEEYQQQLNTSFKGVKLSPFACRIPHGQYQWQQRDYQLQRLAASGHAIHGLLYDAVFTVADQRANAHEAVLELQYAYTGHDAGYPFAYDCRVSYRLLAAHVLEISTTLVNHAGTAIPIMDGWHPYFTTGTPVDELILQFDAVQQVEFNEILVGTGDLLPMKDFVQPRLLKGVELDNSFWLDFSQSGPSCMLHDPKKGISIDFYPDQNHPVLQVYIPPHRRSIAIENLTAAPGAFVNGMGLQQLAPGHAKTFNTRIHVRLA
ncbi:aldose 1-epimerase [Chitinophaga agrisoli]|uniref:Aldose 1-epimerase n=1 Tax=Chitinophaga agrisoli TaxID=2607653 RepID=A0A5B2VSQ0_9BACT|nr:aldose 1-epimerase [Chitinophaga agrisoli]KAA2241874.1 aldose 1-epimerase [Chitinophaga agrisoli]